MLREGRRNNEPEPNIIRDLEYCTECNELREKNTPCDYCTELHIPTVGMYNSVKDTTKIHKEMKQQQKEDIRHDPLTISLLSHANKSKELT